jgi:murein DD-endopeptidase MepM/ murein hydrolase activator NlpD
MWFKKICTLSLILFFANVDYAQLITINTFGKYVTKGKGSDSSTVKPVQSQAQAFDSPVSCELKSPNIINITRADYSLPLSYLTVTSLFGQRYHPILRYNKLHAGIDLRANYEAVFAFAEGIVTKAGYDAYSGNFITILHGCGSEKLTSVYAHLSSLNVKVGDVVQAGQIIGINGNTGYSTAPHLHFALKLDNQVLDPLPVLKYLLQQFNASELNQ